MAPVSPGPAAVSGQGVDVTGSPLAGVPVTIGGLTTSTDATGHFRLTNVPGQPGPLAIDSSHADPVADSMMLMGRSNSSWVTRFLASMNRKRGSAHP